MRILVVSQYFWPENFRVNDLVSEFCKHGHDVTVLTGYPNYPSGIIFPEFKSNPSSYARFQKANVLRMPVISRGNSNLKLLMNYISFVFSATLLGAWSLRGRKFEIVFVYEPSPITVTLPAIFLGYLKSAPVVLWVLDLWPETLKAIGIIRSEYLLKIVGYLVTFIYRRCDLILAQSKSFIPQIQYRCKKFVRVEYFPSWSDSEFDFSKVSLASEIPPLEGAFNIMFAGNIGDAQDFPAILKAAEALKHNRAIRWLIIGEGRTLGWVKSEVIRRNLEQSVLLLGSYPLDRMPSFYKHADAMLVTLKSESIFSMTIPGKMQSYLAAGIPILAMLDGEGASIIDASGAGLSSPAGDGQALAESIIRMAGMSPEERLSMGKLGLTLSMTEFNRSILITKLLAWFERMLLKSGKPQASDS